MPPSLHMKGHLKTLISYLRHRVRAAYALYDNHARHHRRALACVNRRIGVRDARCVLRTGSRLHGALRASASGDRRGASRCVLPPVIDTFFALYAPLCLRKIIGDISRCKTAA